MKKALLNEKRPGFKGKHRLPAFFLNAFIGSAERNGKRIDNNDLKSIV